ncbi:DeoR/GlpR family DNA-binding transcription regulator [Georgenia sp. TF02-10]|uniref:DeoR/GlpR family DNA-binding transcription regulator n=1 Tax=Georgenia sp. TF02-10 TaxID=2917725 RepID=UPI001FA6F200|nr:DeoR/GlpR family DNA-binding transcription regulator [Georgenia sp. TF02-10]UNX54979.1 DeoR/GlpR family DNA-binding transcription regulator [Georgenia sp. TF02-10]
MLELLRAGTTRVEDLSARLGISPSTVRRDLSRLGEEGRLTRTYGGATVEATFRERALAERMGVRTAAKAAVGARAAALLPAEGTIFVDAGTTTAQLAEHLRGRCGLTVLTRGLEIALMLAGEPGLEVVVVGGVVAPKSHGLAGPVTTLTLERFMVDVAFLGVDALDPVDGVGEPTLVEAATKDIASRRARRTVVLADASKLDRGAVPAWAPLARGWTLVTDATDPAVIERYTAEGVEVLTASGPDTGDGGLGGRR